MNHQPYENWILEEEEITALQRKQLLEHLEKCSRCANFEKNWKAARQQVKAMPAVDAPAGFSRRWQASFALRQKIHEKRQARILLISLASAATAVLIALGILVLPQASIVSLLVNLLSDLALLINSVTQLVVLLISFIKAAPVGFLVSLGIFASLAVSLISVIWAFSFFRITMKGIKTSNETI